MRFGVVGDPVDHSRSPAIHRAGYVAVGIDATYERIRVPAGGFARVVADLREGALDGINVTMPHKEAAYEAVDRRSASAERTGAVNTIVVDDGELVGDNTDVDGVSRLLEGLATPVTPILVLGTGGAARAAVVGAGERPVIVAGRRDGRASDVLRRTATTGEVVAWGDPVVGAVVVNATPLGMRGETLPDALVRTSVGLLDMAYGDDPTPAVLEARDRGLPVADGVDMLVAQAARAFELFTGHRVPTEVLAGAART